MSSPYKRQNCVVHRGVPFDPHAKEGQQDSPPELGSHASAGRILENLDELPRLRGSRDLVLSIDDEVRHARDTERVRAPQALVEFLQAELLVLQKLPCLCFI